VPTNRKRTRRVPIGQQETPTWAAELLGGKLPVRDTEAWDSYVSWLYFDERIAGLPRSSTPEGRALWARARDR
jgi:hypothetical protein